MKIVYGDKIAEAVKNSSPEYIAVAFLGKDWREFISDSSKLKKVIISPTLGTNPHAVRDLVTELGWGKVEFLDELHAKLYLGSNCAVMGSANLTKNGLSGFGLDELCCVTNEPEHLQQFMEFFEQIKSKAKQAYPSEESKEVKLAELTRIWNKSISHNLIKPVQEQVNFQHFNLTPENQFYVCWYENADFEDSYSDDLKEMESIKKDEMHFLPEDIIQKNSWILAWKKTVKNKPNKVTKPCWIYIHEIFDNGINDSEYEYSKVAIQRKYLEVPEKPFELTSEVISAFRAAISNKNNEPYFIQPDRKLFCVNYAQEHLEQLISDMKAHLENGE